MSKRYSRWLYRAIVAEIILTLIFLAVLLTGERSRATLIVLYFPRQPFVLAALLGAALARYTRHRHTRVLIIANVILALVVLVPIMGLNVTGASSSSSSATNSARPHRTIRLVSNNVYFGKGVGGRKALVEEIATWDADIIVLQEAFPGLGRALRTRFAGQRTVNQEGEQMLISKLPVRETFVPPDLPDGTKIMFMKYVIDVSPPGQQSEEATPTDAGAPSNSMGRAPSIGPAPALLRIYNVHPFSPRHAMFDNDTSGEDNVSVREAQIAAALADARASTTTPFIIVGDTNLPVLSGIARRHLSDGLTDSFDEAGGFGYGYTFPSRTPWMRIDRAFRSDDSGVKFVGHRVGPRKGTSDHRAIFVDIDVSQ